MNERRIEEFQQHLIFSEFLQFNKLEEIKLEQCKSFESVFNLVKKYKTSLPNLYEMYILALVILVTSAEAERAFSCMKRIKTYLRSLMTEERLNSLAVLSLNKDIKIDIDVVINKFINTKNRRINLTK